MMGYLGQLIYVICVRLGWMKSPSLGMAGEDHRKYRAIIHRDYVSWVLKKPKLPIDKA